MSFAALISDMVSVAMGTIDDLAESVNYIAVNDASYVNGVVTPDESIYTLRGVLGRFRADEMDEEINAVTDMKCLLAAKEMDFDPRLVDRIEARGAMWGIIRVMTPPGKGLWKLQIRKI